MEQAVKYPDITVELVGHDGNAFGIIGRCIKAARKFGVPENQISEFEEEAMGGDYDHLLITAMKWFDIS